MSRTGYSSFALYDQRTYASRTKEREVCFRTDSPGLRVSDSTWAPKLGAIVMARSQREAKQILQLRYQVYTHEMGARLAGADVERGELRDALDPWSFLWYAQENGVAVGTITQTMIADDFDLSLLPAELALHNFPRSASQPVGFSSRFTIAPDHRGSWVLPAMARYTYAHGRELGAKFDFMLTRPALVPLFERVGYLRYTTSAFRLRDFDLLIPMVLPATDYEHLRKVRSACLPCAMHFPHEPEWGAWLRASHPIIGTYYESDPRCEQSGAALTQRTSLPPHVAAELSSMSFVHHFQAGTSLHEPGDRMTCSYLKLRGQLSVRRDPHSNLIDFRQTTDGVAFTQDTIHCDSDAAVLCIPDSALARIVRRYPEQALHVQQLLEDASVTTDSEELLR
ncbi:MAG: hypothetical protein ABJB74_11650 [Gemmatimonas sp.]